MLIWGEIYTQEKHYIYIKRVFVCLRLCDRYHCYCVQEKNATEFGVQILGLGLRICEIYYLIYTYEMIETIGIKVFAQQ